MARLTIRLLIQNSPPFRKHQRTKNLHVIVRQLQSSKIAGVSLKLQPDGPLRAYCLSAGWLAASISLSLKPRAVPVRGFFEERPGFISRLLLLA